MFIRDEIPFLAKTTRAIPLLDTDTGGGRDHGKGEKLLASAEQIRAMEIGIFYPCFSPDLCSHGEDKEEWVLELLEDQDAGLRKLQIGPGGSPGFIPSFLLISLSLTISLSYFSL